MAEIAGREKTSKLTFEEISQLNDRKTELKHQHQAYLKEHPEMKNILADFMCAVLVDKPDDVFDFSKTYFESNKPTKAKRDPVSRCFLACIVFLTVAYFPRQNTTNLSSLAVLQAQEREPSLRC